MTRDEAKTQPIPRETLAELAESYRKQFQEKREGQPQQR